MLRLQSRQNLRDGWPLPEQESLLPGKPLRWRPTSWQEQSGAACKTRLVAALPQMPRARPCQGPPAGLPGSTGSLRAAHTSQMSGDREAHLVVNISLTTWAWIEGPGAHVRSGEGGRLGGGRPLTPPKAALPLEVSGSGHERRWAPVGGLSRWSQKDRGPHRSALPSGRSLSAGSTGPMLGGIFGRDPAWTENANANPDSFWVFHNFQKCLDGGQF